MERLLIVNWTILANINSGEYICTITDAFGCSEDKLFLVDTVFAIEVNANIISDYNGLPLDVMETQTQYY